MNKAITINNLAGVECLTSVAPYTSDPTELFHALCNKKSDSLLLESAEIDSKENLQSLLVIDAALRIVCNGNSVTFTALSQNGVNVKNHIVQNIPSNISFSNGETALTINFPETSDDLDEDSRVKEPSVFDALRLVQHSFDTSDQHKHALFLGGLFAYDLVANFEPLGNTSQIDSCPDYVFYLAETLVTVDHQANTCDVQASLFINDTNERERLEQRVADIVKHCEKTMPLPTATSVTNLELKYSLSDVEFSELVSELKQYVVQGDVFQVVPSRRFSLPCPSPLVAYKELKQSNPSPYMFFMQDEHFTLFGASPESALKYDVMSNQVEIYPIAGTRHRGKQEDGQIDLDLDCRIELELRTDKKENAEHMMLVDLARNDIARISQPGTRHVADLLKVDRYSHVMHLVSRVVGQLRHDLDALHAYQACMNMGTLTGAPKVRAMQLIRQVEKARRGSYGGAVGYLTGEGNFDTCIVIRSAYIENGIAHVQAGAGVVFDSDPQAETDETRGKAQAVISAIQAAHKE
ncbi:anthranilate synthase component 1 [Vibrio caribbeanicus]|uniref:Anthranilate synthase component 1 n=1 Tax=Vibrio caribbeanicus ATCC BAA-2122 TaxID=796620 RepID=E3BL00_9VIBR|nr:anthranilate synthase component 1 [Vibrio caribbeanicus]EFP96344.1 anthranilate synthase component I [Vibrio caribbeanicus ATCC BAA-2122]